MSALGFFRQRQKMVFWIMVFLMIVFLLTIGGIEPFMQLVRPNPQSAAYGQGGAAARYTIKRSDVVQASAHLDILKGIGLGDPRTVLLSPLVPAGRPLDRPGELGFLLLTSETPQGKESANRPIEWLLLVNEAKDLGFKASKSMAKEIFQAWFGVAEDQQDEAMANLRKITQLPGLQISEVYAALEDYSVVSQAFESLGNPIDPSEPQLRHLYRDTEQKMTVGALTFPASDYVKQAGEPTEAQVLELFNEAKKEVPGVPSNTQLFKFGYRLPDRVQLEYVFVDNERILGSAQPSEEAMYEYWQAHQQELIKNAASAPATAPAESQPATAPAMTRYAQFKPEIRRKLAQEEAQRQLGQLGDSILDRVNAALGATSAPAGQSVLEAVAQDMIRNGKPVVYRRTQPMSEAEMTKDPILRVTYRAPNGPYLTDAAFNIKELAGKERAGAIGVGEVYNAVMDVRGSTLQSPRGKLVWRVIQALPSEVPTEEMLQNDPNLHQRVVDDWKLVQGYQIALAEAKKALARVPQVGMAAVGKDLDKRVDESDPLARKEIGPTYVRNPYVAQAIRSAQEYFAWLRDRKGQAPRMYGEAFYVQAARENPIYLDLPEQPLPMEHVWYPDQTEKFLEAIFEMAPADTIPESLAAPSAAQPASQPTSQPASADAVKLVELPGQHAVVVAQRVQFLPAYESTYRTDRGELMRMMRQMQLHDLAMRWFSENNIYQRNNYQPAK